MNRYRTLNGLVPKKSQMVHISIPNEFIFPDNDETKLYTLVYGDGSDISLYMNNKTPPEIRQAIENLLVSQQPLKPYPNDSLAFEMLPKENESASEYQSRLQGIINDAYKSDVDSSSTDE